MSPSEARLEIRLLGGLDVRLGDRRLAFPTRHAAQLLAYLAVERGPCGRDALAAMFWSDRGEEQARGSLRQTLYRLRRTLSALDPPPISSDTRTAELSHANLWCDVTAFESGESDPEAIYDGDFLAGWDKGGEEFENWLRNRRQGLAARAMEMLRERAAACEAIGDAERLRRVAFRLLEIDIFDEAGTRALMITEGLLGRTGPALAAFRRLTGILKDELETEPSHELRLLADDIEKRRGRFATTESTGKLRPSRPPCLARERRHVAVLCVATTARDLSASLDPEWVAACAQELQALMAPVLDTYGARLVQGPGTGFLLWFGWPVGREDVLACAARAATALKESIPGIDRLAPPRLGLACGEMLVGSEQPETGVGEVIGGVPDVAQELAIQARPGQILVSETARNILKSSFEIETSLHQGAPLHLLRRERPLAARFLAPTGPTLGPMVGRDRERDLLLGLWESVESGCGQVVLIRGEPGIGKSCLLECVAREVMGFDEAPALLHASPFFRDTALFPVTEFIRTAAELNPQRSTREQLDRLTGWLDKQGVKGREQTGLIAHAMGLDGRDRFGGMPNSPARVREGIFQALCTLALDRSAQGRFLIGLEDAHWADPTTVELLQRLAAQVVDAPIMMIVTARPEFDPSTLPDEALTVLSLAKLTPNDTSRMIERIAGDRDLPLQVIERIRERTDGVPLFIEEVTRSVLANSDDLIESANMRVPDTLRDSLAIRLDKLGKARSVAQRAACIGRRFDDDLLAVACSDIGVDLADALQVLKRTGLIFRPPHGDEDRFAFRHGLLREAAYESLPRDQRTETHKRIYERMCERLDGQVESSATTAPEQAAWQAECAGLTLEAIRQLKAAASSAAQQLASKEALSHLDRALRLFDSLNDSDANPLERLDLLALLARCRGFAFGYGDERSVEALRQARDVAGAIRGSAHAIPVLIQAYSAHYTRGEFDEVRRVGQEIGALGEWDSSYGPQEVFPARFVAAADLADGAFDAAIDGFEKALSLIDAATEASVLDAHGMDHRAPTRLLCARACQIKGDRCKADSLLAANDVTVRAHGAPQSLILTQVLSALHHVISCDFAKAEALAQEAKIGAERHDLRMWKCYADVYLALSACHLAPSRASFAAYEVARDQLRASQTLASSPFCDARYAMALIKAGDTRKAGETIDHSLQIIAHGRERWSHAELYRVKAMSAWASGADRTAATSYLEKSKQVASDQGAGLWIGLATETENQFAPANVISGGMKSALGA